MRIDNYINLALFSALLISVSCTKAKISDDNPYVRVPMVISAETEDSEFKADTTAKTTLSGKVISWEKGDKISVYDGTASCEFTADKSGPGANFSGEAADVASYIAVSPYSCVTSVSGASSISVKINETQTVDATHCVDPAALVSSKKFAKGAHFRLKNQFSLMKFTIGRSDVKSITLYGNNGEGISGTKNLSKSDGETLSGTPSGKQITLTYSGGSAFPTGSYYIALWPTEFTGGFKIVVCTTDGKRSMKSSSVSTSFAINGGVDLGRIDDMTNWVGEIKTPGELKMFRRLAFSYTSNDVVKLGADINLNGYNWGTIESFAGTFDGQGHSITNFTINNAVTRTGFIGILKPDSELKNVTFGAPGDGSSITLCQSDDANWCYAGIVGYVQPGSKITSVTTNVPVTVSSACTGKHCAGGICGNMKENTTVRNCVNNASVTDNASNTNTAYYSAIGGIVGLSDSAGSLIIGCTKNGEDTDPVTNNSAGTYQAGGIVGRVSGSGTVESCTNNAYVYYNVASAFNDDNWQVGLGGIVGAIKGVNVQIIKCANEQPVRLAAVQNTKAAIGGIVGLGNVVGADNDGLHILGCTNSTDGLGLGIVPTKEIAIGGIIGYSGRTITVSKSSDGVYTSNAGGFAQDYAYGSTAYVGGIAGLLENNSNDNVVEYCYTASGKRFQFNVTGNTSQIINVGGICGASRGVIRHCINNTHIFARKNKSDSTLPAVKYGGICGGASESRCPKLITDCTNNGNFGGYNLNNQSFCGGIVAFMYPGLMEVSFCTNTGTVTTGQCTVDGQFFNPQSNQSTDLGALCGDLALPAQGTDPITIFEGCVIDCKFIVQKQTDYRYIALIAGWTTANDEQTGYPKLIVGTEANPIRIINTTQIETGTDAQPTVESEWYNLNTVSNAKKFLFGTELFRSRPDGGTSKNYGFYSIDDEYFTDRFELHYVISSKTSSSSSSPSISEDI